MADYKNQGRLNRAAGQRFEVKVRKDLESKGWIVIKNPNNVTDNQFKQGKPKFNPFTKSLMMNSGGFPDLILFTPSNLVRLEIFGVEVKSNGRLSKDEKEKCKWLLENNIFSKILIASKGEKGGTIDYEEFK